MEALKDQLVLVTGASGFIASHVVKQLLDCGARVRATVRDPTNEKKVGFLKNLVPQGSDRLELVKADLLETDCWKSAVAGCNYVAHVASPIQTNNPNDPDEFIKPAVQGTLSVLKACSNEPSVKRVVVTSSCLAVYDPAVPIPEPFKQTKKLSEECWMDGENTKLDPYTRSKVLAEKAAWNFVQELPENQKFELSVINPGLVIGPVIHDSNSLSVEIIQKILEGGMPAVPKLMLAFTDVRDVAEAHLKALVTDEAQGHRHLLVTDSAWFKQIAQILQTEFKPKGFCISTLTAPNFVVWLGSLFQRELKLFVPRLGREAYFDNQRMKEVLKVTPTSIETMILDTANKLIELEIVKPKK